jgi:hypothetical protein
MACVSNICLRSGFDWTLPVCTTSTGVMRGTQAKQPSDHGNTCKLEMPKHEIDTLLTQASCCGTRKQSWLGCSKVPWYECLLSHPCEPAESISTQQVSLNPQKHTPRNNSSQFHGLQTKRSNRTERRDRCAPDNTRSLRSE